jgi:hypothetical protein
VEREQQALITGAVVMAVVLRPKLWMVAVVQLFALAPRGWWRRRPYLPAPDPEFLRFRLQTMYGDPTHEPEPADAVAYLEWCRRFRQGLR